MILYLIQLTIIWSIALLCYELIFSKTKYFRLNRMYLLLALFTGVTAPLFSIPVERKSNVYAAAAYVEQAKAAISNDITTPQTAAAPGSIGISGMLWSLYITGIVIMLILTAAEIILIVKWSVFGEYKILNGKKVFINKNIRSPFSFMGWIFLKDEISYNNDHLRYILAHESAHSRFRHWLDMIIMQLFMILFWFHPLVWRYRRNLKLVHEYEADGIIAPRERYDYGTFLFTEAIQTSLPTITHQFFYSPVKNRIAMLTKTEKQKAIFRYATILPLMAIITLLLTSAAGKYERTRNGDVTEYKGNKFYWKDGITDTIEFEDAVTGKTARTYARREETIYKINDTKVADESMSLGQQGPNDYDYYHVLAQFYQGLDADFKKKFKNYNKAVSQIQVNNAVVNPGGKIEYFDITILPADVSNLDKAFLSEEEKNGYTSFVEDWISKHPTIQLLPKNKGQYVYFQSLGAIMLTSFSMQATKAE